jgi:hypothetical protein
MDHIGEMTRIHALPDRFLGRTLLSLSRRAIAAAPDLSAGGHGYESLIIECLLPRLALQLGETGLSPNERAGACATPAPGPDLREFAGTCLNNAAFACFLKEDDPLLRALSLDFANGSPVTIGLDRVCPPVPSASDWVARHIREVCHARFGDERFTAWEPAMQDYPRREIGFRKRALHLDQEEAPPLP